MKHSLTLFFLLLLPVLLHAGEDSPLEGKMKTLARGTKQLSGQLGDPAKRQETLTLLESLERTAGEARDLEPAMAKSIPESQRPSFLAAYRQELDRLSATYVQIGQAVAAGDQARTASLLGQLNALKREGHSRFKQD
jgi:hypothetical protein